MTTEPWFNEIFCIVYINKTVSNSEKCIIKSSREIFNTNFLNLKQSLTIPHVVVPSKYLQKIFVIQILIFSTFFPKWSQMTVH